MASSSPTRAQWFLLGVAAAQSVGAWLVASPHSFYALCVWSVSVLCVLLAPLMRFAVVRGVTVGATAIALCLYPYGWVVQEFFPRYAGLARMVQRDYMPFVCIVLLPLAAAVILGWLFPPKKKEEKKDD